MCPQGDGETLAEAGAVITVQVILEGHIVPNLSPVDIWLRGCDDVWTTICPPASQAINADHPSDENGMTTISGAIAAGGSVTGLWVIVHNWIATGVSYCLGDFICLPITVVSPDIDGDLVVGFVDLALFASNWPPQPYSPSRDFNGDGVIDLRDLSLFAQHWLHSC